MYQGKFEQENSVAEPQAGTTPSADAEMVLQRPVRRQRKKPKPMKTKNLVFWICVLSFVLVAAVATGIGMGLIKDWLINFEYEAKLPETKGQAVFDQLFADPDWEQIYRLAKEPNTKFEGSKAFAAYMEQVVEGEELRLVKVSAGLSDDYKYEIRMGNNQKVAGFTLVECTTDGKKDLALGAVEIIYERKESCAILTTPDATVLINGVALDDSYVIQTVSTNASDYLPAGVRGFETVLYRVNNLMAAPEVTVADANGTQIALVYDQDSKIYSHTIDRAEITDGEKNDLITAAKVYCKYMIGQASKTTLQQYFDSSSDAYKTMTGIDKWMQSYKSYDFAEATITEYYRYSDTLYSARVQMTLNVTRKDDTVKEYPVHNTFIMENQGGSWKVVNMLNLSIQQEKTMVRMTYIDQDGETVLFDGMVNADSKYLTPPAIEIPEGKQLGWYIKVEKANGNTTMSLTFQPDATGRVSLPDDYTLESMVLYARLINKEA